MGTTPEITPISTARVSPKIIRPVEIDRLNSLLDLIRLTSVMGRTLKQKLQDNSKGTRQLDKIIFFISKDSY